MGPLPMPLIMALGVKRPGFEPVTKTGIPQSRLTVTFPFALNTQHTHGMPVELSSVTLKRIGFFCFPIKHSTHTVTLKTNTQARSRRSVPSQVQ
jgi:hypothetical protein